MAKICADLDGAFLRRTMCAIVIKHDMVIVGNLVPEFYTGIYLHFISFNCK